MLAALGCQSVPLETAPAPKPQQKLLLEVIQQTHWIDQSKRLVYLRIFSDGTAKCHPEKNVDYINLKFINNSIPPDKLERLEKLLNDAELETLEGQYPDIVSSKDSFRIWTISIPRDEGSQQVEVVNFAPGHAEHLNRPYPKALVRLGCFIEELRPIVSGESTYVDPYCTQDFEAN
jgi:hypothetical protein